MEKLPKIFLFNTMTRRKEEFIPIKEGFVKFYSCGQTVYEDVHVGNAKTYVVWDLLTRFLKFIGYKVKHLQNFTDVGHLTDDADEGEDKIVKRALKLQEHPMELIDRKIREYHLDMDRININRPNLAPKATAHITEMIDLVVSLLENGYAYEVSGSIYFDISKFKDYGKLARLDLENLKAGARIEVIKGKKNPGDFALWIKAPENHIMQYTSPWGKGYPGWHLECSVMSMKYLGETIDIHAGGIDHIPVHHTNEIAQSEGVTGKKFVNYWIHSEFITLEGKKMSKSTGNFVSLRQLIEEIGAGATRMVLTQSHYRTQADFSMKQAKSTLKRYRRLTRIYHLGLQAIHRSTDENNKLLQISENDLVELTNSKNMEKFIKALSDDLNTPVAFAQINTVSNRIDQSRKAGDVDELTQYLKEFKLMMSIIGVPIIELSRDEITNISEMIKMRNDLRTDGNLESSDKIRNHLQFSKYIIQDLADGSSEWYKFN